MNMKKPLLVAGIASTVVLGGVSGAGVVSAATGSDTASDPMSNLVDKLATKFNVDKSEVQAVFDQDRSERQAAHQKQLEERLSQAVSDGELTSAQKDQILAKLQELKDYRESIKDKDRSEQRNLMKQKKDELKQWAEDNDIPKQYLRFGGHHGGPGGPPPAADQN